MRKHLLIGTILYTIMPIHAPMAQSITVVDAKAEMGKALEAAGAVNKTRRVPTYRERCERLKDPGDSPNDLFSLALTERCRRERAGTRSVPYVEPLQIIELNLVEIRDIQYGEPRYHAIPEKAYRDQSRILNCGSLPTTGNVAFNKTISLMRSIAVTRAVLSGSTTTVAAKVNFNGIGSGSASVAFQRQITVSKASSEQTTEGLTRTVSQAVTTPPGTEMLAEFVVIETHVTLPFTVALIFDGRVDSNDDGYTMISEVLSEEARTFVAEGVITFNAASEGNVRIFESPARCPSAVPQAVILEDQVGDEVVIMLGPKN